MKRIGWICIMILMATSLFGQGQLDEYLRIAAEQNPSLKAKYNMYLASLERVNQQDALPDPTVSFGYFISPVETRVGQQRMKLSKLSSEGSMAKMCGLPAASSVFLPGERSWEEERMSTWTRGKALKAPASVGAPLAHCLCHVDGEVLEASVLCVEGTFETPVSHKSCQKKALAELS